MSDATRADQTFDVSNRLLGRVISPLKKKSRAKPAAGSRRSPGITTRVIVVRGTVESEQLGANDGLYAIEVRVSARHQSNSHRGEVSESLLNNEIKRQLHAIAEGYPKSRETVQAPDDSDDESTDIMTLLRTLA